MTQNASRGPTSEAERLFEEWLVRDEARTLFRDRGESFDAFCTQHTAHADALRRLHAEWERVFEVFDRLGLSSSTDPRAATASLAERLRERFGSGVDPGVTLEPETAGAQPSNFASETLRRLAGRPDASGRYRILGEVAHGGMGAILRVWDEELRRHLAMKVILGRTSPASPSPALGAPTPPVDARSVGRFLEEAQVTGQLDHPGIVPVHELGLDKQGRVFFTMKLVKGEDLEAVLDRLRRDEPGWTVTRILGLLLKVCEAMAFAHAKRVIHRDLKPANVMVGAYGEVFVMDWGLARVLDRKDEKDLRVRPADLPTTSELTSERRAHAAEHPDSPLLTMDGDIVGTPAYMSPEQAQGKLEQMGPPADVYALGAMLYHLLTGRMPYVPPDARVNNYTVLSRVQDGPPTSVSSLAPQAPAELVAICEKAMARDPADRYPDMSALAEDLRAYLEHRVVAAYETGAVAELRKWVVRNKPLATALAAGVLALAGGLSASLVFKAASDRNAQLAEERRKLAQAQESLATQKANDVLSLSAIQELNELVERADALWPAVPSMLPEYERWLDEARILVEGTPGDPARGISPHPGLKDHEAKLAEIRQHALPPNAEQAEKDRRGNPRFSEWEAARAELAWMRRMLGEEPWPTEADVEAALAQEWVPADANTLNGLAWQLVDPDPAKVIYGGEVKALILARRAVTAATEAERPAIRDTVAWALYRCNLPQEALAEEQRAVGGATGEMRQVLELSLDKLQKQIELWAPGEARAKAVDVASKLATHVADLERAVNERRTFELEDAPNRWWHAQLSGLVYDLRAFTDGTSGLYSSGISPQHGWGVARRAAFAHTIEARSVNGPDAARRWAEAIDAIAGSPHYGGLVLEPQLGLMPIGADPQSGLWEFWHLPSGEEPVRGPDGKLLLTESMGLVLVLIPGGTFWMGAQRDDPAGRNYDPATGVGEGPVHEQTLSPYFLSKYEMTQGQWQAFTGSNPSNYAAGQTVGVHLTTLLHPVEHVSWNDAMDVLPRLGLALPTEAQWERGARAGTDTPWSTGRERDTLLGSVNLADQSGARGNHPWPEIEDWPELDDGWVLHSEVGSFRPNPFGLHDMHGNALEWCLDGFATHSYAIKPRLDPANAVRARLRVVRGGSFFGTASNARSAVRQGGAPGERTDDLGIRPAVGITP